MLVPIPPMLAQRLEGFEPEAAAPTRDAATIAVVRQGDTGLDVFLMRRQASMAFAAGMYVFPGGGVQAGDETPIEWVGPSPQQWADRFGCSPDLAHRLVVAAIRETFEETGVLLAGPDEHTVLGDTTDLSWARADLEEKRLTMAEFLAGERLVLRTDLIGAWAHWITPSFEPRRYDTRFFVAALPQGQRIDQVGGEADKSLWAPIDQVLAVVDAGGAAMLPPTSVTCRELAGWSADNVLDAAAARRIRPIEPRPVLVDGTWWLDVDRPEDT